MIFFENDFFRMKEDKKGIVHTTLLKSFGITEKEAQEYLKICNELDKGTDKKLVIMDFRDVNYLTPNALKKLSSTTAANRTKAAAVVVSLQSPLVAIMTSFILKLSNEPYAVKLFTNEEEAINWLRQFKEK